ncbi:MAG: PQQ-binding-like beta-propeller repeat protein [Gemmatimonadales bacterium]
MTRSSRARFPATRWLPIVTVSLGLAAPAAAQPRGPVVYRAHCASCHEGDGSVRAPLVASLSAMTPRAIYAALTKGSMREVAAALPDEDRVAVAEFLTRRKLTPAVMPASAYCSQRGGKSPAPAPTDWTAWSGSPRGTGFRTAEQAGLTATEVPELELRWAFGFPDGTVTRSQPTVAGDLLIVGGQYGEVSALDAATGCIRWTYEGDAAVKGVVAIGPPNDNGQRLAVAADFRGTVVALDLATGQLRWKTAVTDHPANNVTGSPVIHGGRVFVPLSSMEVVAAANPGYRCCTSSGAVVALDLATGAVRWRHRVIAAEATQTDTGRTGQPIFGPAGAPVWSSPTVDPRRGLLYVGTGENYSHPTTTTSDAILALDLATGALAWSFQATERDAWNMACGVQKGANCPTPHGRDIDFGQAPLLVTLADGREILVAGQKAGVVHALDPDRRGAVLWQTRVGRGGALGGIHWGVAAGLGRVFAPVSDRLTPTDSGGPARPGLHALDLATGAPIWHQPAPPCSGRMGCFAAYSAAPVVIPGAVLVGGLDGWLRAYASDDGRLLWAFDTAQTFPTVNGVTARGGAIDGPGPTVAGGMVFVSSGYALFGQMPGNVLLAFGPKRR